MPFSRIHTRFMDYLDGDLSPTERAKVRAHLNAFEEDRREFDALCQLDDAGREAMTFPGQAYAFEALRPRMATITPMEEVRLFLPRLRVTPGLPRYAVAAVLILFFTVTWMWSRPAREGLEHSANAMLGSLDRIEAAYALYLDESTEVSAEEESGDSSDGNPRA